MLFQQKLSGLSLILVFCFTAMGVGASDIIQPLDRSYVKARALNQLGMQLIQDDEALDAIDVFHQALDLASLETARSMRMDIQSNLIAALMDIDFVEESQTVIASALKEVPSRFESTEMLKSALRLAEVIQEFRKKYPQQTEITEAQLQALSDRIEQAASQLVPH